jgi:putative tryptophan/tyrosine transport system substrate-binding protein
LQYDIRRYRGDLALLDRQAAEIAAVPYDVILAGDMLIVAALLKAGAKQPLVVQAGLQMVESGLAASFARPGGQLTGLQWDQAPEVVEKYPELAKDLLPGLKKFGWIIDSTYPGMSRYIPVVERTAHKLGLTLVQVDAGKVEHLEPAFAKLAAEGVLAVSVFCSGFHVSVPRTHLAPSLTAW